MRFALFHSASGFTGGTPYDSRQTGAQPPHGHPANTVHNPNNLPPKADARLNLLLTFGGWQGDSWAEHLPRLLEPLGVRSLRASTAREAINLIRTHPVHIAVVDLRLPFDMACAGGAHSAAEAGARVLDLLNRQPSPPPTVVVKRGRSSRDDARDLAHALRAGVYAAVDPPVHIEDMLRVMRRILERCYGGVWPGGGCPTTPIG